MNNAFAKIQQMSIFCVHVLLTLAKKVRLQSVCAMGFATGGYPSKDNSALERRISTLERLLGSVRLMQIYTPEKALMVLAQENGSGRGGFTLPFQIQASGGKLVAAPGTVHTTAVEKTEITKPSNGTWTFFVKVTINTTTGEITDASAEWSKSEPDDSETEFHRVMAKVEIANGSVDSVDQFDFGPVNVIMRGSTTGSWAAILY